MSTKEKMLEAQAMIKAKKYSEARKILKSVDHPKAREWLDKLDELETVRKSQQSSVNRSKVKKLIMPGRGRSRVYWVFFSIFLCLGCYVFSLFGQIVGIVPTSAQLSATRTLQASTQVAQAATDDAITANTATAQAISRQATAEIQAITQTSDTLSRQMTEDTQALTRSAEALSQQMTVNAQLTNIALTPPIEAPTIDVNGTQSAVLAITIEAGETQVAANLTQAAITPSSTASLEPPTLAPAVTWYTTAGVNARACPTTECDVVTVLIVGTRVDVVGSTEGQAVSGNTTWRMVLAGGQTAYVHSSFLTQTAPRPTSAPVQSLPINPPVVQQPISSTCSCTGGDTLNCDDFNTSSAAQACFDKCMVEVGRDVHGLDGDNNNLACEK